MMTQDIDLHFLEERAALCVEALGHVVAITMKLHERHSQETTWSRCSDDFCRCTVGLLRKSAQGLADKP